MFPLQRSQSSFHQHVQDPTIEDRQAALFNSTCVHASFGDVEFAQVTLRGDCFPMLVLARCVAKLAYTLAVSFCADAINCGLDFETAMKSGDYVKLNSSPQVRVPSAQLTHSHHCKIYAACFTSDIIWCSDLSCSGRSSYSCGSLHKQRIE